jgi:hypothetical protein
LDYCAESARTSLALAEREHDIAFPVAHKSCPVDVIGRGCDRTRKEMTVMPVQIKPITLWRAEVDHRPGALARTLQPLGDARVDLKAVMGYRLPGARTRAAIEVFPVSGAKAMKAAREGGLDEAHISALLIEGDNRAGLGQATAQALADSGINIDFFLGLVSGRRNVAVIGFDSPEDARRAIPIVKGAAAQQRGRKTAKRGPTRAGARRHR